MKFKAKLKIDLNHTLKTKMSEYKLDIKFKMQQPQKVWAL